MNEDACRLVMIYALRYNKHSNCDISSLIDALKKRGVPESLYKVNAKMETIVLLLSIYKTEELNNLN